MEQPSGFHPATDQRITGSNTGRRREDRELRRLIATILGLGPAGRISKLPQDVESGGGSHIGEGDSSKGSWSSRSSKASASKASASAIKHKRTCIFTLKLSMPLCASAAGQAVKMLSINGVDHDLARPLLPTDCFQGQGL
jgi:hypothetical protein